MNREHHLHGGGGVIGVYTALLQDAEEALNRYYTALVKDREYIDKLIAHEFPRGGKNRPEKQRINSVYSRLLRWDNARSWFTKENHGAVTMQQVFDAVAVDREIKREQLRSRFELPWPMNQLQEALEFYHARIRRASLAHPGM